jgi:thiosulfate reductase cytochrome b subunit
MKAGDLDGPEDDLKGSREERKPAADPSPAPEAGTPGPTGEAALGPEKAPSPEASKDTEAPLPAPGEAAASQAAAGAGGAPLPTETAGPSYPVEPALDLSEKSRDEITAVREHPWVVRFCHWLNAVSIFVLVTSGLRIFRAFPSFGPKVPQNDLVDIPKALTLGGWLGGALQWHFTFMWIFVGTGVLYLAYQLLSGHYKTVLFMPRDVGGVWPMVRHYFLFGPEPPVTEQYNPLQKLAYTSTVLFGVASVLTGVVIYKPIQFWYLAWMMGGFHYARLWHFASMCGFLAFIPGHLIMVILHGWNNFASMLTGWKRPGYRIS